MNALTRDLLRVLGGKGSGNFGHAGRPGEQGGSSANPVAISDAVASHKGMEMVAIKDLIGMRTQDRRVEGKSEMNMTEPTETLLPRLTKELKDGAAIQEPLTMAYDREAGKALLMDGNTRLAAIEDAGFTHAPVVISRQSLHGFGRPVKKLSVDDAYSANWLRPSAIGLHTIPHRGSK